MAFSPTPCTPTLRAGPGPRTPTLRGGFFLRKPYQSDQTSEEPNSSTYTNDQPPEPEPDPETLKNIQALLAQVAAEEDFFENDDDFLDSVGETPDLPKLNIQKSAAKILAAAAGQPAARPQTNSPDPPS